MRKILSLVILCLIVIVSFGQQIPTGMKYQGVARDNKGNVLSDQQITLKISLSGNDGRKWSTYYVETHNITTGQLGLFNLVVGEGAVQSGTFATIPWSAVDVYMEVSIKDNSGFATISNSKLLAVPYAFHAMTANQLAGSGARSSGVPSNVWSTFGNSNTNPTTDALGTTDNADLMVITNNIERARVFANGNVDIKRSVAIGANLKVDSTVSLNERSGSTTNNGPFTVARNSPTLLSGTLTVDLASDLNAALNVDGPTDLNSNLNVNNQKPTKLTGTLQVDGVTTLKDSFFVAQKVPSVFTGRMRLDSNGTFKQHLMMDNAALDQDTASLIPNGALQVAGGAGFGGSLTIAGNARIGGGLSLSKLKVTDTTAAVSTTTGAAIIAGGVGIGRQLYVGGKTTIDNSVEVNAGNGQVTINGGTNGGDDASDAYPLVVNGKTQGITVNLNTGTATGDNNFVTFQDNGGVRGRIEGQTEGELTSDPWYQWDVASLTLDVTYAGVDFAVAVYGLFSASADVRTCAGIGVVVCPPNPVKIAEKVFTITYHSVLLGQTIANLASYIVTKKDNIGVSYSSGAGDYAEWLRKSDDRKLMPGQVIGLHHGVISLDTKNADRVLVVSTNPIVLGNNPEKGQEAHFEKVAFLGQVPVRVTGTVKAGDYILASSKHDGTGIAKSADQLTMDDISAIVGIAWTSSDITGEKPVKVAVGLTANDLKGIVQKLQTKVDTHDTEINDLKKQINANNALLAKLLPGYKANSFDISYKEEKVITVDKTPKTTIIQNDPVGKNETTDMAKNLSMVQRLGRMKSGILEEFAKNLQKPEGQRMPEMTDALIDKLMDWGISYTSLNEGSTGNEKNVLQQKLNTDPKFKQDLYNKIKQIYKQKMEEFQLINNN